MERSDKLIKLISVLVFLTLVIYIGYSFYSSRTETLRTVQAVEMELRESVLTEGYAVRDEARLSSSDGSVSVTVSEGEKVASGTTVAVTYSGSTALKRAEEIHEIILQIGQLETMQSGKSQVQSAKESILSLSGAVSSGDLSDLDAILLDVGAYIMEETSVDTSLVDDKLEELNARLKILQSASSGTGTVTAPYSGTFSTAVDGFENVGPEDLEGLTPGELEELFSKPASYGSGVFGKLASGIRWYYVTVVDIKSATALSEHSTVSVEFSRTYSGTITMNVESVGAVSGNECVVVLSCSKYLQDTVAVRNMTAELIFSSSSGIRVPKEAVHLDSDGNTIVYILKGLQAESVPVTITGEESDCYMVGKSGSALRVGDQIITKAANLYDGAVVAS